MTNISTSHQNSKNFELAFTELTKLIGRLKPANAHILVEDLLSDSERIMLVKRFAAALMFAQQHTPYRVSTTLGISISTAQRIHASYQDGTFARIVTSIPNDDQYTFLSLLNDLILAQASPKARARLMNAASKNRP